MKYFLLVAAIIYFALESEAQEYYVAPGGGEELSTDIDSPGDIEFAFLNAPKFSTVYVKAGEYGGVVLDTGFDSTNFIGYFEVPGDLDESSMPDSLSDVDEAYYSTK